MKNETREKEARGERTMRDTENKAKENSVRGLELTAEKINSYSAAEGAKALADLKKQSIHAMEENEAFLMKLLQDNKDTEIGKKYDFASIKTIEEYQKRLPVTIYDDYAGYVIRNIHQRKCWTTFTALTGLT